MFALQTDRRKKMLISAALAVSLAAGLAVPAVAQTAAPYVKVVVDGDPIYLDHPPAIVNGRVLVPLRGVFERLGATVAWDPGSQTVLAQRGATSVALTIGASQAQVNGQPQPLDTPALLVQGRTMVPLRFISQALGAGVNWDAGTYTVQVASPAAAAPPAGAPPGSVPPSVSYGPAPAPAASAPQPPAPAPQPAAQTVTGTVTQVNASVYPGQLSIQTSNGTVFTYRIVSGTAITRVNPGAASAPIPLSAIQAGDAVTITADPAGTAQSVQALNYAPAPQPQAAPQPAAQTTTGTVMQVNAAAYPGQLGVQASNGTLSTYRIVSGTTITRTNVVTGSGGPVPLGAIQPGDAVTVSADPTGTAESVQVSFAEIDGTVAAAGNNQIALQNGQTYLLAPSAQVAQGGLVPGAVVTLRMNPATHQVYAVVLRQPSAGAVPPVPAAPVGPPTVTLTPTGRPLGPGDVLTVTATGPARGTATFSIAGVRGGLPMTESANQPGTYLGTYPVRPGDAATNAIVAVDIVAPGGQLFTATAPAPVAINGGSAGIPPAAGGAPAILSPAAGKGVTTPFTVTGIAAPGSQVRVAADFSKNVIGFNWHGSLGSQTVTADASGNWSATFAQSPPVRGADLTITAVVVDSGGAVRSAPATVKTTLQ